MEQPTLGLRDRKRVESRARMEKAAVELVVRVGLQQATVEAICEAADVSPRTFFNYFDSKEDAVLGLPEIEVDEDIVRRHAETAARVDVVEALVDLILEITSPAIQNTTLHAARSTILQRYPELFSRQLARLTRMTDELLDAVRALMARDPRFSDSAEAASLLAEPILALCSATVRISAKEWIAAGSDAPIDEIKTRAVALAREVVDKLQWPKP